MSPSRGLQSLLRSRTTTIRCLTIRQYSNFVRTVANPENQSQIYISRTDDPYLNLSIEHYLLQKTPADSTVLFVYINRPCIVIGRNQNPWVEANLGMIRNSGLKADLVRRRSGGGTVFHDKGNVNYSVICPTPDFNRDKHAEMVVRALKTLNLEKARVNERHDIVYDKAVISEDSKDTSRNEKSLVEKTFKISGSAYKLTRLRSLHHGTCIAWSQNINAFSRYLRSPTRGLIVARGVESVRSPVTNVERKPEQVEQAVVSEFSTMYNAGEPVVVTGAEMAVPEIAAGVKELKSQDWIYGQTPQFTFSSEDTDSTWVLPPKFKASFTARHGVISDFAIECGGSTPDSGLQTLASYFDGRTLHEITDWSSDLKVGLESSLTMSQAGEVMDKLFGNGNQELIQYIKPWSLSLPDYLELKDNGPLNEKDEQLILEGDKMYGSH